MDQEVALMVGRVQLDQVHHDVGQHTVAFLAIQRGVPEGKGPWARMPFYWAEKA
jgi:hypothetical protein